MGYANPTIADFKTLFARDFAYATPLMVPGVVGATATASIGGQSVSAIAVNTAGSGYPANPATMPVIIYGGGGIGAAAYATSSGGAVTGITVTNGGIGYIESPAVFVPVGGDNSNANKVTDLDIVQAFGAMSHLGS